jgi:hypothetical protein
MSFTNRDVLLTDFLAKVRQRISDSNNPDALAFFDNFLQGELSERLKKMVCDDWDGIVNAGDFDQIYPLVASILHETASRLASEIDPNTYGVASAVSFAFQEELNDFFQCSGEEAFEFIPIKSWSEIMAEEGLVDIVRGPGGEKFVKPKGLG